MAGDASIERCAGLLAPLVGGSGGLETRVEVFRERDELVLLLKLRCCMLSRLGPWLWRRLDCRTEAGEDGARPARRRS